MEFAVAIVTIILILGFILMCADWMAARGLERHHADWTEREVEPPPDEPHANLSRENPGFIAHRRAHRTQRR